jgi:hypothetical protein
MESKLVISAPPCAHKFNLINELAALSEHHFRLTSKLVSGDGFAKLFQECKAIRARWEVATRALNAHKREHRC